MAKKELLPHQFKPGQSGNPNGRPKKSFASVNAMLREEGYNTLSKSDMMDAYGIIFNIDEDRLKKLSKDKKAPYAFRLLILGLNDKKTREKAIQDYRDWTFGKAQQNTDVTTNGASIVKKPVKISFTKKKKDEPKEQNVKIIPRK